MNCRLTLGAMIGREDSTEWPIVVLGGCEVVELSSPRALRRRCYQILS
jgi:hypothetical protein